MCTKHYYLKKKTNTSMVWKRSAANLRHLIDSEPSDWLLLRASHSVIMAPTLVEHVVADAGAFLKNVPLQVRFQACSGRQKRLATQRTIRPSARISSRRLLRSASTVAEATASAQRATRPPHVCVCSHRTASRSCRRGRRIVLFFFVKYHHCSRIAHSADECRL